MEETSAPVYRGRFFSSGWPGLFLFLQQLRQLRDVAGDAPSFVKCQRLAHRGIARRAVDLCERLAFSVQHLVAAFDARNSPRWRSQKLSVWMAIERLRDEAMADPRLSQQNPPRPF